MSELNIYGAVNGNTVTGYPKSDNNGGVSDASTSTIPKDADHLAGGADGAGDPYQISNPQLDRAIAVVREHCAIGRESKKAEN
jgi:hypothetical protein